MNALAHVSSAPEEKSKYVRFIAYALAAIIVIMLVAQLFEFEKFVPLIESFWIPGGTQFATLLAAKIVAIELFALPFLLRVPLSTAMRYISMLCAFVAGILWLFIALWLNLTTNAVSNAGILGTTVPTSVGWWNVIFAFLLTGLALYVIVGTKHRR